MESNVPAIAKRVWNMVRVVFFMMKKGISKGKIMMHLNMMLKHRGKLAGKAIANLMFHHPHHHHGSSSSSDNPHLQFSAGREYEFSCSNTPNYSFFPKRRNQHHRHSHSNNPFFFACAHAPLTQDDDMVAVGNALNVALEMLDNNNVPNNNYSKDMVEASPALPGFGRSPMVRQLRVTDSPFPLQDGNQDRDHQVDKAAEEFINRFYKDLRKQA